MLSCVLCWCLLVFVCVLFVLLLCAVVGWPLFVFPVCWLLRVGCCRVVCCLLFKRGSRLLFVAVCIAFSSLFVVCCRTRFDVVYVLCVVR